MTKLAFDDMPTFAALPAIEQTGVAARTDALAVLRRSGGVAVVSGSDASRLVSEAPCALEALRGQPQVRATMLPEFEPAPRIQPALLWRVAQADLVQNLTFNKPVALLPEPGPNRADVRALMQVMPMFGIDALSDNAQLLVVHSLADIPAGKRAILDLYPALNSSSPLDGQRHLGLSPVLSTPSVTHSAEGLVGLAKRVQSFLSLKSLGAATAKDGPLAFVRCSAFPGGDSGAQLISETLISVLTEAQNDGRILEARSPGEPLPGFLEVNAATAVHELIERPGANVSFLRAGSSALGYVLSFHDSANFPRQGANLRRALEAHGVECAQPLGYVDTIHVTSLGNAAAALSGRNIFAELTAEYLREAADAGIETLIGEIRAYPNPNAASFRLHRRMGWRDSGVALLYPYRETDAGPQFVLSRIMLLDVREACRRLAS